MKYPLYEESRSRLLLPSRRPIEDFSLENLLAGKLGPEDLGISEETLRKQAELAGRAGFPQVAKNLERAAELTRVPDSELLEIYQALRPGRSTPEELEQLAERILRVYRAPVTAAFIREAAAAAETP